MSDLEAKREAKKELDVIDRGVLADLRELDPEHPNEVVAELVGMFNEAAPARLEKMKKAYAAGDIKMLTSEAHTLKSSSANLGAMRVSELSRLLETLARDGALTGADKLIEGLGREIPLALSELAKEVGSQSPGSR